jgi:signal transduction histidine kinase
VLLVLVTAVPLIIFFAAVLLWHSQNEQKLLGQQALRAAAVAAQSVDHELDSTIAALQVLTNSLALANEEYVRFYEKAKSAGGILRDSVIVVYDREGHRVLSTAHPYGQALPSRADMSPLSPPFGTGLPHVSPLFKSDFDGHGAVAVVVPVIVNGSVRNVVVAGIRPSRLSDLLMAGLPPKWIATLLDQNGRIIAESSNAKDPIGSQANPELWFRMQRLGGNTGTVRGLTKAGESVLLTFERSPLSGWSAVINIPPDAVSGDLHQSLWLVAAAATPVLMFALLLAWWAGRGIARPVSDLEGMAMKMERGEQVKALATGVEQFDHLSGAMEHAATAIHEREAKLSAGLQDLRLAHDALRQEQAKKDRFIATLAHELRNPLAPVRTGVQILAESPPADLASSTLAMMGRELDHMVRMIEDLLDVSRITGDKLSLRREHAQLQVLIAQAVESAEPQVRARGQNLVLELPEAPVLAYVDPARLSQVITNLLQNAAKFSSSGDSIRISVSADFGVAEIRIADSGVGLAPESLERIFELFYQVRGAHEPMPSGLGIGLSLSRRLVELHGGKLTAHSEGVGRGATFVVRIPRSAGAQAPDLADPGRPAQPWRQRRVMVVDDNRVAADANGTLLRMHGHTVHVAYDGPGALAVAAEHELDVVLLDIGMPGMDGYEVCRALRGMEGLSRTTIVALTGWGSEHDRQQTLEAGFDGHLIKPARWAEIEAVL